MKKPRIGFIGQGFIGKNYANDFERRGYATVRYALEEPYASNREKIKNCDIVFIAVPTPTTPAGFDSTTVRAVLKLVGKDKIAVIKSTVLPGTTESLQKSFPDRIILYSPEFLSETTAAADAAHPFSNIIGMSAAGARHRKAAEFALRAFPPAPFQLICCSTEAEIIKYAHNSSGYVEIILFNLIYDLARSLGADWEPIETALQSDPYIARRYAKPVHKSGRGAGGHCFIKDVAALRALYAKKVGDKSGLAFLLAAERKNRALLKDSGKDLDLVRGVYGRL